MGPNKTDSIVERDGDEFREGRDLVLMMMMKAMALMMLLMKMEIEKNLRMKIMKKITLQRVLGRGGRADVVREALRGPSN